MAGPEIGLHLIAGTAAGVAQIVVGHPFDTVKVKMQSSVARVGAIQVAAEVMRAEGVKGLYRGMGMLLGTVAACNATLFVSRAAAQNALKRPGKQPTLMDHVLASGFGGAASALVSGPAELIKCRLQHQGAYDVALRNFKTWEASGRMGAAPTLYRGPGDVVRTVWKHERGVRGLATGLRACIVRDAIGCGTMFVVYEALKRATAKAQGIKVEQLGMAPLMMAGGIGGMACWFSVYPVDVIKSRLQTQSAARPLYSGMADCARKVVAEGGVRALYKGLGPCLARSFPANACAFLVYEQAFKMLAARQAAAALATA